MAGADLEEAGQRLRRDIGRVALREILEVPTSRPWSARAVTSAVARTTNVLGCAPGQAAASFSDSRKRLGEIGLIIGISLL